MKKFSLPLLLLASIATSYAETDDPNPKNLLKVDDFQGPVEADPKIKNFQVKVLHEEIFYSFSEGKPYYTSDMAAMIEVHNHKDLKDYGIVQWIRGCHYSSKLVNGVVEKRIDLSRDHMGKSISFKHPIWVVDSMDADPLYWNSSEAGTGKDYGGRTAIYRLDNPHDSDYVSQYRWYYKHNKQHTRYFIQDRPTGADFSGATLGHSNVSLEFKTCLFRHADVPTVSDPEGKAITATPLKCHYWQSNFQYDYQAQKYQLRDEIDPFCTTE